MKTLSELSEKLSSDALPSQIVYAFFQLIGVKKPTKSLEHMLCVLMELAPDFECLKSVFPKLFGVLDLFLLANKVLISFQNHRSEFSFTPTESIDTNDPIFFISEFKVSDFEDAYWSDKLAVFWLLFALSKSTQQFFALSFAIKFSTLFRGLALAKMNVEFENEAHAVDLILDPNNFNAWLDQFLETLDFPELSKVQENLVNFYMRLMDTDVKLVFDHAYQDEIYSVQVNESRRLLDRKGGDLDERQRLGNHIDAFQKTEIDTLTTALKNTLGVSAKTQHTNQYEALLIALALLTGRSIEAALKLQVFYQNDNLKPDIENIESLLIKFMGVKNEFYWRTHIKGHFVNLLILNEVYDSFRKMFTISQIEGQTIRDLLPFSCLPWPQRTLNWVQQTLPNTKDIRYKI